MRIVEQERNIVIKELKDFDLGQTLECGQCFHFVKIGENHYGISAMNKLLECYQKDDELVLVNVTLDDCEKIWIKYFDLERDYGAIKETLLKKDEKLKEAIETMWGVRILNQDFYETLMSFIISQNKQIPHIKQIVAAISEKYGNYLGEIGGIPFYSFPDSNILKNVSIEDFRELKTGFRAPYLFDATRCVNDGIICYDKLISCDSEKCMKELMSVKGIGKKVANCVMLFSLGKRDAFPVDVWIKRIMEDLYFHKDTDNEIIRKYGMSIYGDLSGYAQQYLFYYGRSKNKK